MLFLFQSLTVRAGHPPTRLTPIDIITIMISALSAAIAAPVGAWVGRKLERDKYRIELERLRAEMKDKLAEVKSHELENVFQSP